MSDRLYCGYLVVLLSAVMLGPVLWSGLLVLEQPPVLSALQTPAAPALALVAAALLALVALAAGRVRGPVVLTPFRTSLVAGGPRPRRASLRSPYWRATAIPVAALGTVAALPVLALARSGFLPYWAVPAAVLGGALLGLVVSVCWLVGQVAAGSGWRSLPRPTVSRLLDALSGPVLLAQAHRWQAATTALGAGEASAAVATYRPLPEQARPTGAIRAARGGMPMLFLTRDLVAVLRLPGRCALGVTAMVLGVVVAGTTVVLPAALWWVAIGLGSGFGYLGLGVLSDGVRHAVEAGAAPVLYGVGDLQLVALHSLLPTLGAILLGGLGLFLSLILGGSLWSSALGGGALLLGVAVRVYDAAKPPMPLSLLHPVPTPAGDASGIAVALWQVDALLIATLTPVALGAAVLTLGPWAALLLVPVLGLVLAGARRRLASPAAF